MYHKKAVTIPANTPKTSPIRERIILTAGVIQKVDIEFPAGCAGLVGARILHREFQLWPLTPGEYFVTDNFTITFPARFELNEEPFGLTVEAYNEDTAYDHTLSFRFAISEPEPDVMQQIAEIVEAQKVDVQQPLALQTRQLMEGLKAIYTVLYQIHAQDLPTIAAALQARRW